MHRHALALLFSLTSFVGAALLFLVQPLVVKLVLPLYGGTPTVWNTASLFFQLALLAGYLLTHVLVQRVPARRHAWVHTLLVLLPIVTLPIGLRGIEPGTRVPVVTLVVLLAAAVGAPFLLLSTGGPLLQRWFAATQHPRAHDPYFLYAAGNAGSLLALLGYPLVLEPHLALVQQRHLWSLGYVLWVVLIGSCALVVRRQAARPRTEPGPVPHHLPRADQLRWVALAALASSLMLGTTTHITTDLAPVPLLWVVPLALYLVTFIVAFGVTRARAQRLVGPLASAVPVVVLPLVVLPALGGIPLLVRMGLHLAVLAVVATAAHVRLSAERPGVEGLTRFYLLLAVGGAVGGAVNGLVAPVVLERLYEYPVALAAAVLLLPRRAGARTWFERRYGVLGTALILTVTVGAPGLLRGTLNRFDLHALVGLVAAAALGLLLARRRAALAGGVGLVLLAPLVTADALATSRSFFGVQEVSQDRHVHVLSHGTTTHGWQDMRDGRRHLAQSYYEASGPAGQVMRALPSRPVDVGVVGLGSGSLAAYGRRGDSFTFFEIDRDTVDIARNPRLFTYLQDSQAQVDVRLGDGRLSLVDDPPASFDVLLLDAFSSDAVPVHLLTREAVELYLSRIRPDGRVLIHISNRYLALAPVLGDVVAAIGAAGLVQEHPGDVEAGGVASTWVMVARDRDALGTFRTDPRWTALEAKAAGRRPWSDDYSDLIRALD